MRADLALALKRRQAAAVSDPVERVKALRAAVEEAEALGDFTVFSAALGAYENEVRAHPIVDLLI